MSTQGVGKVFSTITSDNHISMSEADALDVAIDDVLEGGEDQFITAAEQGIASGKYTADPDVPLVLQGLRILKKTRGEAVASSTGKGAAIGTAAGAVAGLALGASTILGAPVGAVMLAPVGLTVGTIFGLSVGLLDD